MAAEKAKPSAVGKKMRFFRNRLFSVLLNFNTLKQGIMLENLISLFFPKVCPGCHMLLLGNEKVICTNCRHELPLTQFHLHPENEGYKKFYGRIPVEFVAAMLYYHKKGIVQGLIHSLKYKGRQEIGTFLGEWYAEDLSAIAILRTVDCIVPI